MSDGEIVPAMKRSALEQIAGRRAPSKAGAFIASAIIPGTGLMYAGRVKSGAVVLAAFTVLMTVGSVVGAWIPFFLMAVAWLAQAGWSAAAAWDRGHEIGKSR